MPSHARLARGGRHKREVFVATGADVLQDKGVEGPNVTILTNLLQFFNRLPLESRLCVFSVYV